MKPINNYLIVKELEIGATLAGLKMGEGDIKALRYSRAEVMHKSDSITEVKVGDIIFYGKGQAFSLPVKGESRTVIRISDVVIIE